MPLIKSWTWSVDGEEFFWHFSAYSDCGDSMDPVWLFGSTGGAITCLLWERSSVHTTVQ